MLTPSRGGFSLIEICIAIVILTAAVLGLAASSGSMLSPVNDAETEFVALQYVEDRLTEVRLDPRYPVLDSIYGTTETTLLGLPGARRETTFTRTRTAEPNGKWVDYWTVVATVSGGRLRQPVVRKLVVAAP